MPAATTYQQWSGWRECHLDLEPFQLLAIRSEPCKTPVDEMGFAPSAFDRRLEQPRKALEDGQDGDETDQATDMDGELEGSEPVTEFS